jgi:hypothetical protein
MYVMPDNDCNMQTPADFISAPSMTGEGGGGWEGGGGTGVGLGRGLTGPAS